MIPKTGITQEQFESLIDNNEKNKYQNKDFKLRDDNTIGGYVDGIEAVKQAIFFILQTERYSSHTMSDDVGIELYDLYGKDPALIESTLVRLIRECILADDRIESIEDMNLKRVKRGVYEFSATVISNIGEVAVKEEVNIIDDK
ncbi:DUF2634 domain-containing protein [Peptostreptococcus faecalis]|uniref:DUF2634 domain-containing protein n=1 Tax=Peptostreptococcus faecalis TaxID=2045015 RepID=UPI000C7CB9AA|nr:DUF2634 domain-containing protein [Peptostreptococcus faecalis]